MKPSIAAFSGFALGARPRRNIGLVTNDRVDPRLLALLVKLDRAVEVAVIGQRDRVHPQAFDVRDQLGNAVGPVEQTVVAVAMEMNEAHEGWSMKEVG